MAWYFLAIIGMVISSFAIIGRKKIMSGEHSLDYYSTSFLLSITTFLSFGVWALLCEFDMPPLHLFVLIFVLNMVLGILGWLTNQKGLSILDVSEYRVLLTSSLVITWVASWLLLDIGPTVVQGVGILLIIVAVLIIFLNKKQLSHSNRIGISFTLITALIYGIAFLTDQIIYRESEPASYMLIGFGITAFLLGLMRPAVLKKTKLLLDYRTGPLLLLTGAGIGASLVFIFSALKITDNAPLLAGFLQLQIILTVVFGMVFLSERKNIKRKILGTILATAGAILLVI